MASKADMMAEAYRRGLLPPDRAALYEEAARRGLVNDPYAHGRATAKADPANAAFETGVRAVGFGLPEAKAALGSLAGMAFQAIGGQKPDFGSNWAAQRADSQGMVDQYQQDHPVGSSLAKGVGLAAPAAAALLTGGATAAPALAARTAATGGLGATAGRVAAGTARNAITGAAIGAGYGASQPGTVHERLQSAEGGIIPGAIGGVSIPVALATAKGAVNAVGGAASRFGSVASEMLDSASRAVTGKTPMDQARPIPPAVAAQGRQAALAYLARQGVTPEALEAAKTQAGAKPITTAEAGGPALISQASGLARRAGATPAIADATMSARGADRGARILGDLHEITGVHPEAAKGNIDAIVQAGQKAAAPLYETALGSTDPVFSDRLAELAQRPVIAKAVNSASASLRNAGKDPSALDWITSRITSPREVLPGRTVASPPVTTEVQTAETRPTAETWDLIKRHVQDQIERNPITGAPMPDSISPGNRDVGVAARDLTQALRDHIPGYGEALDTAGDYLSTRGAYERGQGTLFSPSRDPRDFDAYFSGLSPAEQDATRASMANDIFTNVNNGRLKPGAFAPPAVQQKLVTAFGPEKAQAIIDRMATEAKMSAASARMTPNMNSVTGDVVGADADRGDADTALRLAGAAGNAITGRPISAIRGVAGAMLPFVSAARAPLGMATRDALGSMLYQDPAATAEAMRASMNAINVSPPAIPRSVVSLGLVPQIAYDQDQQQAQ